MPTKIPLAYRDWGGPDPKILFLHGFLANQQVWDPLIEHLKHRCRPLTVDLLGFGASSHPHSTYDIPTQVESLHHWIQSLHLPPLILVGHSFGGWVAAAYAIAHPHHLQALILLAPAGIRDDHFAGRYRRLLPLLWDSPWVDRFLDWGSPIAALLGQSHPWHKLKQFRHHLNRQPLARQFLRQRQRPEAATDTVEGSLAEITAPTLVIAAEQDDTIPLWHCQTYANGIPK
ncbi:MAG: alpha/beta hydrolase, partial [Thermostichales cyanobacterium SZTDM-1c_bins_54]